MAGINVTFNGRSLQTAIATAEEIDHLSMPEKALSVIGLARADGAKITNQNYKPKSIPIPGKLIGTSVADLDAKIDQLKIDLSADSANLDIDYNSGTRRYISTLASLTLRRIAGGNALGYTAEFLCPSGMGQDTAVTTILSATTFTTQPSNQAITVGGTANKQQLVITCVVNSYTGSTINSITLKNNTTSQGITVTRLWAANDSLVIDVANQTCKVNGVAADFTGVFPSFPTGSQTLTYTDDFSARNVTLSATYNKRYL